jgi:putative transposase
LAVEFDATSQDGAVLAERVSAGTVSDLNQKIYERIEAWRQRPIEGEHAYVFLDGIWMKRSWGGEVQSVSVLVAIGVTEEGYREILGVADRCKEVCVVPIGHKTLPSKTREKPAD